VGSREDGGGLTLAQRLALTKAATVTVSRGDELLLSETCIAPVDKMC